MRREINSFDDPELVADMLTDGELDAALAHALEKDNVAGIMALGYEVELRRDRMAWRSGRPALILVRDQE